MIEARGVTVRFGGITALDGVSFTAESSMITGLVGPNGAGKTTLFGVLSGLVRPNAGSVVLAGEDVTSSSPQRRARKGLARTFQRIELFAELTTREHLVIAYRARHERQRLWSDLLGIHRTRKNQVEDDVVDRLIEELGLGPVAGRVAASLPLGTGRLIEVGRALATQPAVLLLDEPSSGLDTGETEALAGVFMRACRDHDVALVLVEHNLDLVLSLCSRISVLDFGRMIATGTPDDIRRNPDVQVAYMGATDR